MIAKTPIRRSPRTPNSPVWRGRSTFSTRASFRLRDIDDFPESTDPEGLVHDLAGQPGFLEAERQLKGEEQYRQAEERNSCPAGPGCKLGRLNRMDDETESPLTEGLDDLADGDGLSRRSIDHRPQDQ